MPDLFAEYGIEEYVPKKHRPEVLNPRKPAFWICIGVVAAVACLVICLLTGVFDGVSAGDARKLAKCREALQQWQNLDSYHLTMENEFAGNIMGGSDQVDYWKNGDSWLMRSETVAVDYTSEIHILYKDGMHYERIISDSPLNGGSDTLWQELNGGIDFLPWLHTFVWDEHTFTVTSSQQEQGCEVITLLVTERAPDKNSPYFLCFSFYSNGTLESIILMNASVNVYHSSPGDSGFNVEAEAWIHFMTLESTNSAGIAQTIEAAYQEVLQQSEE